MYRPIVFINMPAFMKAYQELQRQRKSSSVSNRLFQSLKLEDQIYDAASQKVPHLKEILKCKPREMIYMVGDATPAGWPRPFS